MHKASKRVAQMDVLKMRPTTPDVGLRYGGAMVFGGKDLNRLTFAAEREAGRRDGRLQEVIILCLFENN